MGSSKSEIAVEGDRYVLTEVHIMYCFHSWSERPEKHAETTLQLFNRVDYSIFLMRKTRCDDVEVDFHSIH